MKTIRINEAEAVFSTLLAAVESGEVIAITRHGRIVARIVPEMRRSPPPLSYPRPRDSRMALEPQSVTDTGLLAPLD